MAIKYKLVEKSTNPRDTEAPKKWYAVPQSETALDDKEMTRAATKNTTLAPIELQAALELLADFIPSQLKQGHTVRIPGLGYFRATFKSEGADTVEGFNPGEMIHDLRPVFVPDKAFREALSKDVAFEDGGVLKDGVSYRSRVDFKLATDPSEGDEEEETPGTV